MKPTCEKCGNEENNRRVGMGHSVGGTKKEQYICGKCGSAFVSFPEVSQINLPS